jgi:Putative rhamnosyl transferase
VVTDPDNVPLGDAPLRLADVPLVVVTRFSFLGKSGWKSDASRDAALLFSADRLRLRLDLFRWITLPSLASQTRQDFTHVILTSKRLPDWAMTELRQACVAVYGQDDRFTILAEPPGPAAIALRRHLSASFPGPLVAQTVLDDDDGLASDFVADVRSHLAELDATEAGAARKPPVFLSFAGGYGFEIGLVENGSIDARLYQHSYPYINCGLTIVAAPEAAKNILGIKHQKDPPANGAVLVRGKRMFLRSVHGMNDSRVARTDRWKPVEPWRQAGNIRERFPWLLDRAAFWNDGLD